MFWSQNKPANFCCNMLCQRIVIPASECNGSRRGYAALWMIFNTFRRIENCFRDFIYVFVLRWLRLSADTFCRVFLKYFLFRIAICDVRFPDNSSSFFVANIIFSTGAWCSCTTEAMINIARLVSKFWTEILSFFTNRHSSVWTVIPGKLSKVFLLWTYVGQSSLVFWNAESYSSLDIRMMFLLFIIFMTLSNLLIEFVFSDTTGAACDGIIWKYFYLFDSDWNFNQSTYVW